jgi:p-aminobenzoyl-glutamate transporter AbgT
MMLPLQVPGGPELLVILLMFLVPLAVVGAVVYVLRRRSDRVEELESRIEELERDQQTQD